MSNCTIARISADTGLSIDEAEEHLSNGSICYDRHTNRYFIDSPQLQKQRKIAMYNKEIKRLRRQYGVSETLRWLTR